MTVAAAADIITTKKSNFFTDEEPAGFLEEPTGSFVMFGKSVSEGGGACKMGG